MRAFSIATLTAATLLAAPANAASLGGRLHSLSSRFNEVAARLGVEHRLETGRCFSRVSSGCSYKVSAGVSADATSERDGTTLGSMTATFSGPDAQHDLAAVLLVTMAMFAPDASDVERRRVAAELGRSLTARGHATGTLAGVAYGLITAPRDRSVTLMIRR